MSSKYGIAKEIISAIPARAEPDSIDPVDVQEATLVMLVQELKSTRGVGYLRGVLQYELDSLGSEGVFDLQRGSGHS